MLAQTWSDKLSNRIEIGAAKQVEDFDVRSFGTEHLGRQFQEVLDRLALGGNSTFRTEYEAVHRAWRRASDNEKKLLLRYRQLNAETLENYQKVQSAIKLSEQDTTSLEQIREDNSQLEETLRKKDSQIAELVGQVESVTTQVEMEQMTVLRLEEERESFRLVQAQLEQKLSDAQARREEMLQSLSVHEHQINEAKREMKALSDSNLNLEERVATSTLEIQQLEEALATSEHVTVEANSQLKNSGVELEKTKQDVQRLEEEILARNNELYEAKRAVSETRAREMSLLQGSKRVQSELKKTKSQVQTALMEKKLLEDEVGCLRESTDTHVHELANAKAELQSIKAQLNALQKQLLTERANFSKADMKRSQLTAELQKLQLERDALQLITEKLRADAQSHRGEAERVFAQLNAEKSRSQLQFNEAKSTSNHLIRLDKEVSDKSKRLDALSRELQDMEREKQKYAESANEAFADLLNAKENLRLKDMSILELQKDVGEIERKLSQQQHLYEQARSDRNVYHSDMIEAQDELLVVKQRVKLNQGEISQLQEEVKNSESVIAKERYVISKLEKERGYLRSESDTLVQQTKELNELCGNAQREISSLKRQCQAISNELHAKTCECNSITQKRDSLLSQLVARDHEISLLYEKTQIQQNVLQKGQLHFNTLNEEFRLCRLRANDLLRQTIIYKEQYTKLGNSRRAIVLLEKELASEKVKVASLSDETRIPQNVHRWRLLQGSDPMTFNLVQKIQNLQRRLIARTDQAIESQMQLELLKEANTKLEALVTTRSSKDVHLKLSQFRQDLSKRSDQLQATLSELNGAHFLINEVEEECSKRVAEALCWKGRYLKLKSTSRSAEDTDTDSMDVQLVCMERELQDLTVTSTKY